MAFIVNSTGTILKGIGEMVGSRLEIYTVYPALIDTVGDVGSVVGSTATTRLFLGFLEPSLSSMRNHAKRIFSTWAASITMFFSYAFLSLLIQGILTLPEFLKLATILILTNIIAVPLIVVISYLSAILTFKRGLDPDNFVIPIETSLADSITSITLFISLLLIELI